MPTTGTIRKATDGTLEQVAFGEPEGSGEARAVDACLGQGQVLATYTSDLPYFVKTGIAMLVSQQKGKSDKLQARPFLPFGSAECVFALPIVVDEDGVVDAVTLYTEPDGTHRQRRACFIGIFSVEKEVGKFAIVEGAQVRTTPSISRVSRLDVIELLNREIGSHSPQFPAPGDGRA